MNDVPRENEGRFHPLVEQAAVGVAEIVMEKAIWNSGPTMPARDNRDLAVRLRGKS